MPETRPNVLGMRIRELRTARRLTLDAAAGLAGMSRSMLSYIERGERVLERRTHIEGLAYALQVSPSHLINLPFEATDVERTRAHAHVDSIRRALVGTELGFAPHAARRGLADVIAAADECGSRLCLDGDYAAAAGQLADVIVELHAYTVEGTGDQMAAALRGIVGACCTATALTKELGEPDLAWIAAERARQAARELDDPTLMGVAALHVGYALESHERDLLEVERAIARLQPYVGDDSPAMQVYGNLHLRAAYCSSIYDRADRVSDHLAEADELAARTGNGTAFNLFFGPANAVIWRVSMAVEAGEVGRLRELTDGADVAAMPSRWRQAMYWTDLGRGFAQARRDDESETAFLAAETLAPVYVRSHPLARSAVLDVRNRRRRHATSRAFAGLAYRMGIA